MPRVKKDGLKAGPQKAPEDRDPIHRVLKVDAGDPSLACLRRAVFGQERICEHIGPRAELGICDLCDLSVIKILGKELARKAFPYYPEDRLKRLIRALELLDISGYNFRDHQTSSPQTSLI